MIDLRLGDCVERTLGIPDASIDLVLTSPPYDNLRRYSSGSAFDFEALAGQLKRVLKPGGVLVWVVGDETIDGGESGTSFRQSLHFQAIGLRRHDTMIYGKSNPLPLNHPRYEQAFEFMFIHSKGRPKTVNLLQESCLREGEQGGCSHRRRHKHDGEEPARMHGGRKPVGGTKPRPNIWYYPVGTERIDGHPAVFPLQLAIDHILSWTNPGDIVLDPFVGSGTVGEACIETDRNGIGIDIDPGYIAIAERRIVAATARTPLFVG
jgi:DNA modification methylase